MDSRKRKHPSATLTRSRSQLFLHLNRSGLAPRMEKPYTELLPFLGNGTGCKKTKRDDDDLPRILTKDLRARRVYSPPQSNASDFAGCTDRKFAELGFGSSPSAGNSDTKIQAAESPDLGTSSKAGSLDRGTCDTSGESSKMLDRKQCDGINGGDCSEIIDDLDGELVLTATTPDGEMCGNLKVNGDKVKRENKVRVIDTPSTGNLEENAEEGFPQKDRQRNDSALKRKSALAPRFQGKLFKAPGSVNYGRLFPFLTDIMRDNSGTPKLGFCQKDEKGMDGQEFQLPLPSQSQEASKQGLMTDSCSMRDDKCLNGSKADAIAEFCGVKGVGNALHNGDFVQCFSPINNLDYAKASNHSGCTSQQFRVLNEECILTTPPDDEIYGNSEVNVDQYESTPQDVNNVKPMDLTKSTREKAGGGFCLKADKGEDSLNRQSVRGQHLHRKLFKAPGSVSYRRLLPFLMDLTNDDSGTSKFGHQTHHQKDEADMSVERFQLPFSSKSEEASIDEPKTDSSPMHGTVESNALENNILVNFSNELCHGSQPKLIPSQDLPELPMQLDAKEVVTEGLSVPTAKKAIENFVIGSKDERLSESKFDACSVMAGNFHCAKNVANGAHNEGFKQVQNRISGQHRSESPPKNQNMLHLKGNGSDHTFEHHASQEKIFTINYDERKQFVNLEERESVRRSFPECQCLTQLNPKMLDAEENGTGSHATSRGDDSVVLNHVQASNEEPTSPSGKNIPESSDMGGHGGDEKGSFLNAIVFGSRMASNGSDDKNASDIENGSESKTTSVLNRCSRVKLLKHVGSFNYKRLLPFLSSVVKENSCNSGTRQRTGLRACDLNNDSSSQQSQIPEIQSSHDSCKAIQLQDKQVVLSGHYQPDSYTDPSISVHGMDLPITLSTAIINDVITGEEKTTCASSKSSVISEVKGNSSFLITSNEKPTKTHECCQSLSQLRVPAVNFKKGILKRNPRGCRGICTCLNCVSFRLHAERAFEFSRNQLLDAEEVARDLMKELSDLRNMLKRSTDNVKNSPVFCGSQVKEACRKAFAAEQLAKDRLVQMNDDLNIHCRITSLQRPRVTFADHVEEKVIQSGG